MRGTGKGHARTLQRLCGDAARQVHGLETRLRTHLAGAEPGPDLALIEETVQCSLQLAKLLLDAGARAEHGTLLAHRPLLRAIATTRPVATPDRGY